MRGTLFKKLTFLSAVFFLSLVFFILNPKESFADYKCKVSAGTCVPCTPDPSDPFDITKCNIGAICANPSEPTSQCGGVSLANCPDTDTELEGFTLLACAPAPTIPPPISPAIQPIPKAPVACNETRNDEFHSLRPYQASICNTDYQTGLYCGNSVYLTDTFTETKEGITTPSDPGTTLLSKNCVDHPELGVVVCDFGLNRLKTFSIDLHDLELPIMGNTEDVRNYTTSDYTKPESIDDLEKVNEYTSWYLNGVSNRAEYPYLSWDLQRVDWGIKDEHDLVDMSGPLNKLLPLRIQQRERINQVNNAVASIAKTATGIDQRHNQIVACTGKPRAVEILALFGFPNLDIELPIPCNRLNFWQSLVLAENRKRLTEFILPENQPPIEEDYADRPFVDYWKAYKEWRGNLCAKVPLPFGTILFCVNSPIQDIGIPSYVAEIFPYIPYSSTEDTLGKVRVEQNPQPIGQSDPIVVSNEIVSQAQANIYVPHMPENYQLADTLQQTFVPQDLPLDAPADETTTVGDEFCNVVQVKTNPGDNLFGNALNPQLSYDSTFSCQFGLPPKERTSACYDASKECHPVCEPDPIFGIPICHEECDSDARCYPTGYQSCSNSWGQQGCDTDYFCAEDCDPPQTAECRFTTLHSIPVYTETPYIDQVWSKLVAGPTSVFKRIFPKIGFDGPLSEIIDAPVAMTSSYTTTDPGTTVRAGTSASGVAAQLYFPHIGGIHEYFLECIQTALRPQELGRECGNFNTPESTSIAGTAILSFLVQNSTGGKYPQIENSGLDIHLTSNPKEIATYWRKTETAPQFGTPIGIGNAKGDADYTSPGIAMGRDGSAYTVWISQDTHSIFFRRRTSAGTWETQRTAYQSGNFLAHARIAVAANGDIFIIWHEDNQIRFATSSGDGSNWSGAASIGSVYGAQPSSIAAGPDGEMAIAYTDLTTVHAAVLGSNGFQNENASAGIPRGDGNAQPSITIAKGGIVVVAWRKVNGGLYVSTRSTTGVWSPVPIQTPKPAFGTISVNADTSGGLHLFWVTGSDHSAYYTYKAPGGPWIGTQLVENTGNFMANADGVASSGGRYYHGVAEEFLLNDPLPRIHYFLISGGGTGVGVTITPPGGGTPPAGQCALPTAADILTKISSWGLPAPHADFYNGARGYTQLRGQLNETKANWSALSMLAGEQYAKSHGFGSLQDYLTTAWLWFENGSGSYPNVYSINCNDNRSGFISATSAYCASSNFQIAGYQAAGKNYQTTYNQLYPGASNDTFRATINTVVQNSNLYAGTTSWKYQGSLDLLQYLQEVLQSGTVSQMAQTGNELVGFPNDQSGRKRQLLSLIAGKDPNMVAALNSGAVAGSLVTGLRGGGCVYGYICVTERQILSNMVYALWLLSCGQ